MIRFAASILAVMLLGGCGAAVEYGDIEHSKLSESAICNPAATDAQAIADKAFFMVTSRLPDCTSGQPMLTNHRSDRVRYARFAAPQLVAVPTSFQPEADWWQGLRAAADLKQGRVLLYVHGFRESIDSSSRDTAQIATLTQFDGPVIQYSWPSQGKLLSYGVDETNMYWDERNFRRFLTKLTAEKWVKEIIVVSHSLGARLVIPAIEYVDANSSNADSSNISNIILASPDVDRQDFERDIGEQVLTIKRVNKDRRITVYASANDKALALSRSVHGYPRLGSPYCFNPFDAKKLKADGRLIRCYASATAYPVAPAKSGFTIIDTSAVSQGPVGHSDYLRSATACKDFAAVVNGGRDNVAGRIATHLPHVFRLELHDKNAKVDHATDCDQLR